MHRCPGEQGQVHVAVRKLLAYYPSEVGSITTTGHSLGGALASLCALDLVLALLLGRVRVGKGRDGLQLVFGARELTTFRVSH